MSEENNSKFKTIWTIFGGAIASIASTLLVIVLSILNNNIISARTDTEAAISDLRKQINEMSSKIGASEGRREAYKEKYEKLEAMVKANQERIGIIEKSRDADKEKVVAVEKIIELLKETDKEIKSELKNKVNAKKE